MKRAKIILIWIVGIMFTITGSVKFLNLDPMSAEMFDRADFPLWLFYTAATFELIGGVLLIIERTRLYGAAMISFVMLGAIGTHLILNDHFGHMIVPALIIAFAVTLFGSFKK